MRKAPAEFTPITRPFNVDLEDAVLGILLANGTSVFEQVAGILTASEFDHAPNRATFSAILRLAGEGARIDPKTVAAALDGRVGRRGLEVPCL